MGEKQNMHLLTIEAYAMPSSSFVKNDSHCFVCTQDKQTSWKNGGRGWNDSGERIKVAENQAYKEWLMEFCPPNNLNKCGIKFLKNGVCHTYANRELLIGEQNVSAREAAKDYVCIFLFGKYGLGLNQLKQLLRDSYNKVMQSYKDPYNALDKVLARVDDYLQEELVAWYMVGMEYMKIPIDRILEKSPTAGKAEATRRLQNFINERENLYQTYQKGEISDLKEALKNLIKQHCKDYLDMLRSIGYITSDENKIYYENMDNFISKLGRAVQLQRVYMESHAYLSLTAALELVDE